MAVVEMSRVRVVGAVRLREEVLGRLQAVGAVHVHCEVTPDPIEARILRVIAAVGPPGTEPARADVTLLDSLEALLETRDELRATLVNLEAERAELTAWGEVDAEVVEELASGGLTLRLYRGPLEDLPDGCHETRVPAGVVVASFHPDPIVDAPCVEPPPRPASRVDMDLETARGELERVRKSLEDLSAGHRLDVLLTRVRDRNQVADVRAALPDFGEIFGLVGFCPVERIATVQHVLDDLPLGVFFEVPDSEDDVPVALRNAPGVRVFEPLLSAFALPRYGEPDPTPLFAPFMGIFAGFCLGDLGYGALLTGLSLGGLAVVKSQVARSGLQLLALLGGFSTVVGALLGVAFGVRLYDLFGWSDSAWLFSLTEDPKRFFYASLAFGLAQLGFGMSVRLYRRLRARRWQESIGAVAWMGMLPAAMAWGGGYGGPSPFVALSVLIVLFSAPEPKLTHRLGKGAWALYGVSSLFGNVASYARIFGLGLSSGVIAQVVNEIAWSLGDSWLGWLGAGVVLVVGHSFNFAMATVGAVVHPARLQFLEFFGTFFEGGGKPWTPLAIGGRDA